MIDPRNTRQNDNMIFVTPEEKKISLIFLACTRHSEEGIQCNIYVTWDKIDFLYIFSFYEKKVQKD